MCNAWNHSPHCTCGWGGDGHSGTSLAGGGGGTWVLPPDYYADYFRHFQWSDFPSYVVPNAKCPQCGASVYFYQSPYGGRVFFDDLGPPWPKHPCTDSSQFRAPRPNAKRVTGHLKVDAEQIRPDNAPLPKWTSEGWKPFVAQSVKVEGAKLVAMGYVVESSGRKEMKVTCSMDSNRYYECNDSGTLIGINFLMNSGRMIDALREGLVMVRYKTEKTVEVEILFMTHLHEVKRLAIQ